MTLRTYTDIEQRSDQWYALRCGIVTASVVGRLVTGKTLATARNDQSRDLHTLLVSEQITGRVEPMWQSSDMLRGVLDEPVARDAYSQWARVPVVECGFMVRDDWGFPIGYSPDGLVGDLGLIEIKSRLPKKQVQTILADEVPPENMAQIQCGLLVSGRSWCDYVSFCGGLPLWVKRVYPDPKWHTAIVDAVGNFTELAAGMRHVYDQRVDGLPMTERTNYELDLVI